MTQKAFEGLLSLKVLIRSISSEDVLVRNEFECEMIIFTILTHYLRPEKGAEMYLIGVFPFLPSFFFFFF